MQCGERETRYLPKWYIYNENVPFGQIICPNGTPLMTCDSFAQVVHFHYKSTTWANTNWANSICPSCICPSGMLPVSIESHILYLVKGSEYILYMLHLILNCILSVLVSHITSGSLMRSNEAVSDSKCAWLVMKHPVMSRLTRNCIPFWCNFVQKSQKSARLCENLEKVRYYAEIAKLCKIMRKLPNYAKSHWPH